MTAAVSRRRTSIPLDLLLCAWLGSFFAWCARDRLRLDGVWSQPSITLVGLFVGMILVPCALYFYLAHPDWSWLYLVDPARIPRLAVVSIVAAWAAAVVGAYYGSARLLRASRDKVVVGLLAGGGLVLFVGAFLARGRLMRYGSYEAFHAGRALPLGDVKLGYVLIAVVIGGLAAAAFVGWELMRDGRRAAAR